MARRMPISFFRSSTEMYVITAIMIEETMSEIETKATSMAETMSTMRVTELMIVPTRSVQVMTLSSSPAARMSSLYPLRMEPTDSLLSKSLG